MPGVDRLAADYDAKRRILEIVCLNCTLDGANPVPEMRKLFDVGAQQSEGTGPLLGLRDAETVFGRAKAAVTVRPCGVAAKPSSDAFLAPLPAMARSPRISVPELPDARQNDGYGRVGTTSMASIVLTASVMLSIPPDPRNVSIRSSEPLNPPGPIGVLTPT